MSSSDDSEDILDPLSEELRNIQSVIFITRENIDALNSKFASFQEPPPMYVQEYGDLTSRLHELELIERELVEKIQQIENVETVDESVEASVQLCVRTVDIILFFYWRNQKFRNKPKLN